MESSNCTNCGKLLNDGDWKSKSGLCRACAEAQYDEKNKKKYIRFIYIGLAVIFVSVVTLLVTLWPDLPSAKELAEPYKLLGVISDTNNAVYVGFSSDRLNISDKVRKAICNAIYIEKAKEYDNIQIITVVIVDSHVDTIYNSFSYILEDDQLINLDSEMAETALLLAEGN